MCVDIAELALQFVFVGERELHCRRRRGCAQIGDEIGYREVDLMTDS